MPLVAYFPPPVAIVKLILHFELSQIVGNYKQYLNILQEIFSSCGR